MLLIHSAIFGLATIAPMSRCPVPAALQPVTPPQARRLVAARATAEPKRLSNLKKLGITQANAAAATIVETNTLLDPVARQCVDCKPTQDALAKQRKALLPVGMRARLAKFRLFGAYKMIELADKVPVLETATTLLWRASRTLVAASICTYATILFTLLVAMAFPGIPFVTEASAARDASNVLFRVPLLLFSLEVAVS